MFSSQFLVTSSNSTFLAVTRHILTFVLQKISSLTKTSTVVHVPGHVNSKGEKAEWVIKSHTTGKIVSSHATKEEAEKHLKQIEQFKHIK